MFFCEILSLHDFLSNVFQSRSYNEECKHINKTKNNSHVFPFHKNLVFNLNHHFSFCCFIIISLPLKNKISYLTSITFSITIDKNCPMKIMLTQIANIC